MRPDLKPPRTVYHGTDAAFERFDLDTSLGAHFGTEQAAIDRLKDTGKHKVDYISLPCENGWVVREANWSNRPAFEHGPFEDEAAADQFILRAPRFREPLAFEIDVYRPLELEDLGTWSFETVFTHLVRRRAEEFGHQADDIWSAWNQSSERGWAALKDAITTAGYDCIAYRNETEDAGSVSWIVMNPERIHAKWKPADGVAEFQRPRMRA